MYVVQINLIFCAASLAAHDRMKDYEHIMNKLRMIESSMILTLTEDINTLSLLEDTFLLIAQSGFSKVQISF